MLLVLRKHLGSKHDQRSHGVRHRTPGSDIEKAAKLATLRSRNLPKWVRDNWPHAMGMPVVFTVAMLKKNRKHHPEVERYYGRLFEVIGNPTHVQPNRRDQDMVIFWKVLDDEDRVLRAAVLMPEDGSGKLPSVLSFRLAQQKDGARLLRKE